eukprot:3571506-Heterocapsa_arctica.AAC.1
MAAPAVAAHVAQPAPMAAAMATPMAVAVPVDAAEAALAAAPMAVASPLLPETQAGDPELAIGAAPA